MQSGYLKGLLKDEHNLAPSFISNHTSLVFPKRLKGNFGEEIRDGNKSLRASRQEDEAKAVM